MKSAGILDRLNDRLNPIVVKELRQAVQSKFVVGVLLLFLLVQVSIIGIDLVLGVGREAADSFTLREGRTLFSIIQSILLATCMLCIPAYAGVRLAAERSDVNVDLLFITALRPRAIISGKLLAALVLVVLIFSACTPFMVFTYLLRGIDVISIGLVLAVDFGAAALAIQMAIFFAVVPGNRVVKILLGLFGFICLVWGYVGIMATTIALLDVGGGYLTEGQGFWLNVAVIAVSSLTLFGLFFAWSVAHINPPSANRTLGIRLFLVVAWLATGVVYGLANVQTEMRNAYLFTWALFMAGLMCLNVMIAVNERERWGPRVARTIPRRWWLRWPAFLLYSGAAGGVVFSVIMIGLTTYVLLIWQNLPSAQPQGSVQVFEPAYQFLAVMFLYTLAYALTAVLVRRCSRSKIAAVYTWLVMLILVGVGSTIPFLLSFLLHYGHWTYRSDYQWLATIPFAAVAEIGSPVFDAQEHTWFFLGFAGIWAGIVALLNIPWFIRQMANFRPYVRQGGVLSGRDMPLTVTAAEGATTKTAAVSKQGDR